MPSTLIKIESDELDHYQTIERAVYALRFYLLDCHHPGWCQCKYEVRRLINHLAEKIDAHRVMAKIQVIAKESSVPRVDDSLSMVPHTRSDWAKSSGSMNLPGPEKP